MSSPQDVVAQIPILPPPSSYLEVTYKDQWKAANEIVTKTVFGLTWYNDYLLGCTSAGAVVVWHVPSNIFQDKDDGDKDEEMHQCDFVRRNLSQDAYTKEKKIDSKGPDEHYGGVPTSNPKRWKPLFKFQATSKVLYSISMLNHSASIILGVCGDDGILLYSWRDIENCILNPNGAIQITPISHFRPHESQNVVEINDFDMDQNCSLYGASGDHFGCYKWDTESQTLLKTYPSLQGGYLHTLKILPASSNAGGHSLLLLSGEGGILGVWDRKQDQLVENIDIKATMNGNASLVTHSSTSKGFSRWNNSTHLWTSHIHSASEESPWWHICGGAENNRKNGEPGGYMTCWHAPTRSLAAGSVTRENLSRMASWSSSSSSSVASIANESVVSYWSSTLVERKGRFWCTTPCAYAMAAREIDGWTAVGGVGNTVDVMEFEGSKMFSLYLA